MTYKAYPFPAHPDKVEHLTSGELHRLLSDFAWKVDHLGRIFRYHGYALGISFAYNFEDDHDTVSFEPRPMAGAFMNIIEERRPRA